MQPLTVGGHKYLNTSKYNKGMFWCPQGPDLFRCGIVGTKRCSNTYGQVLYLV